MERSAAKAVAASSGAPCSQPYVVRSADSCDGVRSKAVAASGDASAGALSWTDFYRYNPGINCDSLFPPSALATSSPVEVRQRQRDGGSEAGMGESVADSVRGFMFLGALTHVLLLLYGMQCMHIRRAVTRGGLALLHNGPAGMLCALHALKQPCPHLTLSPPFRGMGIHAVDITLKGGRAFRS